MCSHVPNKGEQPVESPSAVRHVDELMSSRSESNGLQAEQYDGIKTYTLDIAATGIEAKEQSAKMIHKGCEYYMPIVGHIKENALVLGDEFREGNITPASGNLNFINYCIRQMPKGKRIKALRSVPPEADCLPS